MGGNRASEDEEMNVDTLSIVFEAETKKAESQVERFDDAIESVGDEAVKTDKKVEAMEKEIDKAGKSADKSASRFDIVASKLLGIVAAAASATAVFAGIGNRALEIEQIASSANAIGESAANIDAFGRAMEAMGGDAQGARDSLTDMSESIGEALQDMESGRAKVFNALGISLKGLDGQAVAPIEAMFRLADSVQGLSKQEAVFRIKELGITDNKTVEAILKGRAELKRMMDVQKASGELTEEQIEQAKQYREQLGGLKASLRSAGNAGFQALMPYMTKFFDYLNKGTEWVKENQDLVKGFFIGVAAVIGAVYLPTMAVAAATTLAAAAPFILIGAAVAAVAAAFALAYDDVMTFLDGGESVTGMLVNRFQPQIEAAKEAIDSFFGVIRAGWESVKGVWDKLANFGSFVGGEAKASIRAFLGESAGASSNPLASTTSNAISNSASSNATENNVAVGSVTVNSQATDASGVAKDIRGELASQLKNLQTESATGAVA